MINKIDIFALGMIASIVIGWGIWITLKVVRG